MSSHYNADNRNADNRNADKRNIDDRDAAAYQVAETERLLKTLRPASCKLSRERFFYEAGRQHAALVAEPTDRGQVGRLWIWSTAALLLISLGLGGTLLLDELNNVAPGEGELIEFAENQRPQNGDAPFARHELVLGSRARPLVGDDETLPVIQQKLQEGDYRRRVGPEPGKVASQPQAPPIPAAPEAKGSGA